LPFLSKMTSVRSVMIAAYPSEVPSWDNEEVCAVNVSERQ
jgi:hypothetical protein